PGRSRFRHIGLLPLLGDWADIVVKLVRAQTNAGGHCCPPADAHAWTYALLRDHDLAAPPHVGVTVVLPLVVAGARMLAIDLDVLRLFPGPPFALGGPVAVRVTVGDDARIEGHGDVRRDR